MSDREEFSVFVYDEDRSYAVERWLNAEDAVRLAHLCSLSGAARRGHIQRIIITDGGDHTVFVWETGKGVTFPERT
jgi:hypothetical protein